jgi:hypothetical protein
MEMVIDSASESIVVLFVSLIRYVETGGLFRLAVGLMQQFSSFHSYGCSFLFRPNLMFSLWRQKPDAVGQLLGQVLPDSGRSSELAIGRCAFCSSEHPNFHSLSVGRGVSTFTTSRSART